MEGRQLRMNFPGWGQMHPGFLQCFDTVGWVAGKASNSQSSGNIAHINYHMLPQESESTYGFKFQMSSDDVK